MKRYDLIVIGGGAGGLVVAAGAAGVGASVALLERAQLGGDCLWTGCVPTKSLIHTAKIVHMAQQAKHVGLTMTGFPDFMTAKERKVQAIATIQKHDDPDRFLKMGIDVYQGYGSFIGPHEVSIDDSQVIQGKRIVIATGSRPYVPPIQGLKDAGFITNETALQLNQQPKTLMVVGGGPIGVEFAQFFARFGTQVTLVEKSQVILTKEDPELVSYVRNSLQSDGVSIITGAKVMEVTKTENGKSVLIENEGNKSTVVVDEIMIASGRYPNTDHLCLEKIGLHTEKGFVSVNQRLQTKFPHIYAVGDVNGQYPFTHAAAYESKIVVSNAIFGLRRKVDYSNLPWVTFTDPEVFHLGLTEEQARENYEQIKVYKTDLSEVDRFVADGETGGLIKIITDKKGYILGAHAVGFGAGEWMQEVVFAKQHNHKIGSISHVIHPYPTHVGAVQQTADLYWREQLFKGWLPKLLRKYIQWFR